MLGGGVEHLYSQHAGPEAGGLLSSRPAWYTEQVLGGPELHRETLTQKIKSLIVASLLGSA